MVVDTAPVSEVVELKVSRLLTDIISGWRTGKRHAWSEGGMWSTKTWSVLQFIKLLAEKHPEALVISVVAETMPHLRRSAIRDFINIMGDDFRDKAWNKSNFTYTFPSGTIVEFFSADKPEKLKGSRRDLLFVNEANNIEYESFQQMDRRTRLYTISDWNPTSEFWFHRENLIDSPNDIYIHSTYLDAVGIIPDDIIKRNIEAYRDKDPNWWRVYGLGLIGKLEGLVYPKFEQVKELPVGEYFYGLDYGYSSDPTVLIKNVIEGDRLYSQEMFYQVKGITGEPMTNDQIAREMTLCGVKYEPVYADPDEPKSAEELRKLGFNMMDVVKGKGSVEFGTQRVNQYYQYWTEDSLNCIKEQRNFMWIKDKMTGEFTNRTTHQWSHGMAGRRYAVASYRVYSSMKPRKSSAW